MQRKSLTAWATEAKAALEEFRIPYWDPFLPRQKQADAEEYKYGIPIIFTLPEIMVRRPAAPKIWKPAKNPLYQFKFPTDSKEPGIDFSGFQTENMPDVPDAVKKNTIRGYDGSTSNPDHVFVMKTVDDDYNPSSTLGNSVAQRIYRVMFDPEQDWMMMSNHFLPTDRKNPVYNANRLKAFMTTFTMHSGQANAPQKLMPIISHCGLLVICPTRHMLGESQNPSY